MDCASTERLTEIGLEEKTIYAWTKPSVDPVSVFILGIH